jgi:histidinol-phosphate aminotransferase
MKHDEIISILDSANKNDTLVLLDEAYYGYYDGTYIGYINSYPNLIVTRSFTKIYGLGCARLGFAVSNAEAISNLKKVRPIYEVNSFSVLLGCYVIDHPEILKEHKALFKEGKDYLIKALKKMNIDFFNTDANFILIKMKDKKQAQTVADGLKQRKILVKAGFAEKPLCACIRVSISRVEYMKRFIDNLSDIIKSKVDTR